MPADHSERSSPKILNKKRPPPMYVHPGFISYVPSVAVAVAVLQPRQLAVAAGHPVGRCRLHLRHPSLPFSSPFLPLFLLLLLLLLLLLQVPCRRIRT